MSNSSVFNIHAFKESLEDFLISTAEGALKSEEDATDFFTLPMEIQKVSELKRKLIIKKFVGKYTETLDDEGYFREESKISESKIKELYDKTWTKILGNTADEKTEQEE